MPDPKPAPLTMSAEHERIMRHFAEQVLPEGVEDPTRHERGRQMLAWAELDATRAKLAEAEAIVVQSHCDLTTLNRSLTAAESRVAALTEALTGLAALVRGECPALLDEDSGGDARLALTIEAALSPSQDAKGGA